MNKQIKDLKYIGPYLSERFAQQNIHTVEDLILALEGKSRDEITLFLAAILQNRRKGQCIPYGPKKPFIVRDGPKGYGKYQYCVRNVNVYGWRTVINTLKTTKKIPAKSLPPVDRPRLQQCPPTYCLMEAMQMLKENEDIGGDDIFDDDEEDDDDELIAPLPEPVAPPKPKRRPRDQPTGYGLFGLDWDQELTGDLKKDMEHKFKTVRVIAGGKKKRRKRAPTPREKRKAYEVYLSGVLDGKDRELTWPVLQLLVVFFDRSTRHQTGPRRGQLMTRCELARLLVRQGMGTQNWTEVDPSCTIPETQIPAFQTIKTYSRRSRSKSR